MANYLVTGTSRGLGLELIKQLGVASSVGTVFATARSSPSPALENAITSSKGRVQFVQLDVTDSASVNAAYKSIEQKLAGKGLDCLINNAGISAYEGKGASGMEHLDNMMLTNVSGVHRVSSTFLPLLHKGNEKKIMNMSSTLGSIGLVKHFGMAAPTSSYKISKAALNMLTAQYAMELEKDNFTILAISPGWLKTELGGVDYADLEPDVGARGVLEIINTSSPKDTGAFRNIHVPGHPNYEGDALNPSW